MCVVCVCVVCVYVWCGWCVCVCVVRSDFGSGFCMLCVWCVCLGYGWWVRVNARVSVVCVWFGDVFGVRLCACVMVCVCGV